MTEDGREAAKAGAQAPEPSGESPAPCRAFRIRTMGSRDWRCTLARVVALHLDSVLVARDGIPSREVLKVERHGQQGVARDHQCAREASPSSVASTVTERREPRSELWALLALPAECGSARGDPADALRAALARPAVVRLGGAAIGSAHEHWSSRP